MYSRKIDDEVLSFGVSGKLWNGVLVMYDRKSETLWTQLDGRGLRGDLAGERLEHVESVFTTWAQWRERHPDTLVLAKSAEEEPLSRSRYADYLADPDALMFDELAEGLGGAAGPKDVVFGLTPGSGSGAALAVAETLLAREPVLNLVLDGRPVALLRSPATGGVAAVEREQGGRVLILAPLELDDPAELALDLRSQEAVDVRGLEPVRVDRAFWYAWSRSHPGSALLLE